MYISNKSVAGINDVLIWEEKNLEYNYKKENYREKVLYFNIDEVIDIINHNFNLFFSF